MKTNGVCHLFVAKFGQQADLNGEFFRVKKRWGIHKRHRIVNFPRLDHGDPNTIQTEDLIWCNLNVYRQQGFDSSTNILFRRCMTDSWVLCWCLVVLHTYDFVLLLQVMDLIIIAEGNITSSLLWSWSLGWVRGEIGLYMYSYLRFVYRIYIWLWLSSPSRVFVESTCVFGSHAGNADFFL